MGKRFLQRAQSGLQLALTEGAGPSRGARPRGSGEHRGVPWGSAHLNLEHLQAPLQRVELLIELGQLVLGRRLCRSQRRETHVSWKKKKMRTRYSWADIHGNHRVIEEKLSTNISLPPPFPMDFHWTIFIRENRRLKKISNSSKSLIGKIEEWDPTILT